MMDTLNGCFMIEDDDLLEKDNTAWNEVSADIKKEFDSEPVFNSFFFENQNKTSWLWSYRFLQSTNS